MKAYIDYDPDNINDAYVVKVNSSIKYGIAAMREYYEHLIRTNIHNRPPKPTKCLMCENLHVELRKMAKISPYAKHFCAECRETKLYKSEVSRMYINLSRTRNRNQSADLTLPEWLECIKFFSYQCAYCQEAPFSCMEHIIPVENGGGTTLNNVLPACHKCNSKKGRTPYIDVESEQLIKIQEWFVKAINL